MKQRSKSLPVLVLVAVMALVLGSFATATAAGVTTSQVKKIAKKQAKKVVKKMAPGLSVASAANANNSTLLNGLPASAYQETASVVTLPNKATATSNITYALPTVPAGNYFITINFSANFAATANMSCILNQGGVTNALIWSYAGVFNTFGWINHSRVASVAATGALSMFCTTTGGVNFTTPIPGSNQNTVTFQPLDSVTSGGTATAPRAEARQATISGR
jgi:hypothetical protein